MPKVEMLKTYNAEQIKKVEPRRITNKILRTSRNSERWKYNNIETTSSNRYTIE